MPSDQVNAEFSHLMWTNFLGLDSVKSITDWNNKVTSYTYDADSNILTQSNPNNTQTLSAFDATDAMSSTNEATTANPTNPFATFGYTRAGDGAVTGTTATGVPADNHTYDYDAAGRLTTVDNNASSSYGYDAGGNLTSQPGSLQQNYDHADELTYSTAKPAISLVGTAGAGDSTSKTLTITLPAATAAGDQVIVAATLDQSHTVTAPPGYSSVGTFTSGSKNTSAQVAVFTHTVTAGETSVTVGFSAKIAKTVTVAVYRNLHPTSPIDVTANWSANASTSVAVPTVTTTSTGDRLLLITGADGKSGSWTAPSNFTTRIQKVGGSTDSSISDQALDAPGTTAQGLATHTTSTELVSVTVALRQAQTSYAYDQQGERTSILSIDGNTSALTYDQAGRLTSDNGTTFTYGPGDLRASTTTTGTNGSTTNFTWDPTAGGMLLQAGTWSYLYGADGNPIEQSNGTTVDYFVHDQLGSTRLLTDNTGATVATYTYGPYGALTGKTGTDDTNLRWAGQYQDKESGLYYLRARYYDAATGGFISRDPLEAETGQPYQYGNDDPLNEMDPSGLFCGPKCWAENAWNATGGQVVSTVSGIIDHGRLPDYVNINLGGVYPMLGPVGLGGGVNITITRHGQLYYGPEAGGGIAGVSGSVRAGWINQGSTPSACQIDQFVHGFGLTASGYTPMLFGVAGPSVGETWGDEGGTHANDFSTEVGIGFGGGRYVGANQGYNFQAPFNVPGW